LLSSKIGFEGWFKVEALGALGSQVKRLYNQGADLELVNGIFIELKNSANCSSSRFLAGLTQHQDKPQYSRLACLFIGGGSERQISSCLKGLELASTVPAHEKFPAGTNDARRGEGPGDWAT
jgi:hypothetical protein